MPFFPVVSCFMVWLHGSDPGYLGPQVHQQTGALPYPLQVLEYNLSQVSVCVSLTTEFRTFEQTLQPLSFSYSFSLSLLITSSFVALFSVESMVSGYTMLTRTTLCRTAMLEGGCLNPFLVAVMTGVTVTGYVPPPFANSTCTGREMA